MRIAILGAGYAGLTVTRRLERELPDEIELVLVNDTEHHLVQHELHRMIRRPELRETLTIPLEEIVNRAEVTHDQVTAIDPDSNQVTLTENGTLEYDIGVICLGAETKFYGFESVREHAIPLKRTEHAQSIRNAALTTNNGDAVVGGGGFSGIQAAGELAALSEEQDLGLDVRIVEIADRLAPNFDPTFTNAIREELEARGVRIETGVSIESATDESVSLADGRSLPADVFLWTGGIRGSDAAAGNRFEAGPELQVTADTFVVGDAGKITDATGTLAPASAHTSLRQARIAAANIEELATTRLDGGEDGDAIAAFEYYTFDTPGWIVSVGDGAVAHVGPLIMSGEPAKAAKATIGAAHLSSVGAISQASNLVAEELGWPTTDKLDVPAEFIESYVDSWPTDPATPGEFEYPLAHLGTSLLELVSQDETVDLTGLTREMDSTHPDAHLNAFSDGLRETMNLATELSSLFFAGSTDRDSQDRTDDHDGEAESD